MLKETRPRFRLMQRPAVFYLSLLALPLLLAEREIGGSSTRILATKKDNDGTEGAEILSIARLCKKAYPTFGAS
ncbi:MAG: hypothetical protein WBF13_07245 [Candidatus Zixiibacteriota bacterium]